MPHSESASTLGSIVRRYGLEATERPFCTVVAGRLRTTITFGDLWRGAASYASTYRRLGIVPGDVVPIILQHGAHLYYSFVGALLAGAVPTFMPFPSAKQRPDFYWADHEALFARLQPRLIVTYGDNARAAERFLSSRPALLVAGDDVLDTQGGDEFPGLLAGPDEVACLQHSSGTTGLKKGVELTHRAIVEQVGAYARAIGFGASDVIASWLPLYHDMGFVACFMMSIVRGTHLVALDPFEWVMRPYMLLDAVESYHATFCWLPNFAYAHLARTVPPERRFDLRSLRSVINCSEPCKAETMERFAARFAPDGIDRSMLGVCYAMAENVFAVTQTTPGTAFHTLEVDRDALSRNEVVPGGAGEFGKMLVSCGRPIDGVGLEIRTAGGATAADLAIGEIHVAGPYLFNGYYKQPELTERKLKNGWYATGDLGFVRDGEVFVTGRVDDMIIVNGRNFYAHEIEQAVNDVAGVIPGRCTAFGVEDGATDATSVAVLAECRSESVDAAKTARLIREVVQDRLGCAVHAVQLVPAGMLIKTTSGKISRVKNRELYLRGDFHDVATAVK